MTYRLKLVILIFALLYVAIIGLFFLFYRELILKDAKQEAFYVLEIMNATRDYVSQTQRPLIDELKSNGKLDPDFFDPRLLSASHITHEIYAIQLNKGVVNYDYKLVSQNPASPKHEGSAFENEILDGFKKGKYSEFAKIVADKNQSYVFVGLPIVNSHKSCLACHGQDVSVKQTGGKDLDKFGEVGEVVAMMSFKKPIRNILLFHAREFIFSGIALLILFVIFIFCVYKIHEKVTKMNEQKELLIINQSRLASMGEMISNISHQWKQPLAQISSTLINLELLNERDKLPREKLSEKLEDIDAQVKFMSSTIDDFREFFNPNSHKTNFSSQDAIMRACKLLNSTLKKFAIDVEIDIRDNFAHFGNINEIIQILINVINNAKDAFLQTNIKYKSIQIVSLNNNGIHEITIKNNAKRIDESIIDKIFEPHFTTKKSGSGLGLYMSKKIMQKNGGDIKVANIKDGVVFTIEFLNL